MLVAGVLIAAPARAEGRRCEPPPDPAPADLPQQAQSDPQARSEADARPQRARVDLAPKAQLEPAGLASARWLAGPGSVLGLGVSGLAELACAPPSVARSVLSQAVVAASSALGLDPELAVVFTTQALGCSSIYYVPLANDTRGIGYQHADPREVFDDTPGQRLEGVAFLNDWPYWQARPDELASAFNHELGHRWGARVHALVGGEASSALLGRGHDHWSYFLDSGGSPLEGNVWLEGASVSAGSSAGASASGLEAASGGDGASARASDTPRYPTRFSALDRYLMGVLPAAEVPPLELLLEPQSSARDCAGRALGPASPPQTCGSLALDARATSVSIEDVIAVEGPRSPPASDSVRHVGVLVLVLESRGEAWSATDCRLVTSSVQERLAAFEPASAGGVRLQNVIGDVTRHGASCDELERASAELAASRAAGAERASGSAVPDAASCGAGPAAARRSSRAGALALALAAIAAGRRRRAQRTPEPARAARPDL